MASGQEKTEKATPRRLSKARSEGQVPRSKDLTTSLMLIISSISLLLFGAFIVNGLSEVFKKNFSLNREEIFDNGFMLIHLGTSFVEATYAFLPFFAVVVVSAVYAHTVMGGWVFTTKALSPQLNRLDPVSGFKRMFSLKSLVELVKSVGKIFVVVAAAFLVMQATKSQLLGLSNEPVEQGMKHSVLLSLYTLIALSFTTLLIAAIDVPFQQYSFAKKMRMSRQEVKDEMKQTEGNPQVKGKIRRMQQEQAMRRMMGEVPKADVVITNPTHYSVALRYDPDTMETPILLAKGTDLIALKIREIANVHKIEKIEAPLLARAIYYTTELEGEIPQGLYVAVAQVLAYIFQLREYRKGKCDRPSYPRRLNIPPEMSRF